jgi:hypothetical protein
MIVFYGEDLKGNLAPRVTSGTPAKLFKRDPAKVSKRLLAMARLFALLSSDGVEDCELVAESITEWAELASGEHYTAALSRQIQGNPEAYLRWWLPALFNREMAEARFVMWWPKDEQLRPAVLCANDEMASIAGLFWSRLRACLNCGEMFVPDPADQKYCDPYGCGSRYRQRKYRMNLARKGGKQREAAHKKGRSSASKTAGPGGRVKNLKLNSRSGKVLRTRLRKPQSARKRGSTQ